VSDPDPLDKHMKLGWKTSERGVVFADGKRTDRQAPGSSISKSEHTVINIGGPDAPKLVGCTSFTTLYLLLTPMARLLASRRLKATSGTLVCHVHSIQLGAC